MTDKELTIELERAYRCIQGIHSALKIAQTVFPAEAYHSLTIGAAKRFVFEGALDGSNYFEGKHVSVLHDALRLGVNMTDKTTPIVAQPAAPNPEEKKAQIRYMNLVMDLRRVLDWETPLNNFPEIAELEALLATHSNKPNTNTAQAAQPAAPVASSEPTPNIVLAALGQRHFGKLVPKEWYAAAKELLASPQTTSPVQPAIKIGDIVEFRGEIFKAICYGDVFGTFDLHVHPKDRVGDQWRNVRGADLIIVNQPEVVDMSAILERDLLAKKHKLVRDTLAHHGIKDVHTTLVADLIHGLEELTTPVSNTDCQRYKAVRYAVTLGPYSPLWNGLVNMSKSKVRVSKEDVDSFIDESIAAKDT